MPLLPQDQDFIELLRDRHNITITEQDLCDLALFQFDLQNKQRVRLANTPNLATVDAQNGKILGILAFGVLGLLLGGLPGLFIGLSIGFKLFGGDKKKKKEDERKYSQPYGFDGVTSLVPLGGVVPLIYCDRDTNPNGGIRTSGFLVNSRVETSFGGQRLFQLYALGVGQLGSVDETEILFNDQLRDRFLANEVQTSVRVGTFDQLPPTGFTYYSQAVTLQSNNTLGVDRRSIVKSSSITGQTTAVSLINIQGGYEASYNPTAFVKNSGAYASACSNDTVNGDGYGECAIGNFGYYSTIGLTNNVASNGIGDINYAIRCRPDGQFEVLEFGVRKFVSGSGVTPTYAANDVFRLEVNGNVVSYKQNNATFYSSTIYASYPLRLVVLIEDSTVTANYVQLYNLRLGNSITTVTGSVETGNSTVITVSADDIDRFTPSDAYWANGINFRLVAKSSINFHANTVAITADQVINLSHGSELYAVYKASFDTTKRVSEIHINLLCNLWARDDKGNLLAFGASWDVYVCPYAPGAVPNIFLGRLYTQSKNPNGVRRGFKIINLPLNKYSVELRPLQYAYNTTMYYLDDSNTFNTISTGVNIAGQQIFLVLEGGGLMDYNAAGNVMRYGGNKKQVSSENGAPIHITTINEVVQPGAIGQPGITNNAGIATLAANALASDRLQQSPNISILIRRGRIINVHYAAGIAAASSAYNRLDDLTGNFVANGVVFGFTLRNLTTRQEAGVTTVTTTSIYTNVPLNWNSGDRYLVYFKAPSNYFPDLYVDTLISTNGGLGHLIDPDEYIDYPSVVRSRRFCVAKQFFWDGQVEQVEAWSTWAEREAAASLLHPSRIAGRFALVPEDENATVVAVFNASNINKDSYSEEYSDWSEHQVNSLTVKWYDGSNQDKQFKPKTVTIQTADAYSGAEILVEENLELKSVTNLGQAITIGQVSLKTKRAQNQQVTFSTGLQGIYLQPGDLILVQTIETEYGGDCSGIAIAVGVFINGSQGVALSSPISVSIDSTFSVAVLHRASGNTDSGLPVGYGNGVVSATYAGGYYGIGGLSEPIVVGDYICVGRDQLVSRTYKVTQLQPSDASVQITGLLWQKTMLDSSGLVVI